MDRNSMTERAEWCASASFKYISVQYILRMSKVSTVSMNSWHDSIWANTWAVFNMSLLHIIGLFKEEYCEAINYTGADIQTSSSLKYTDTEMNHNTNKMVLVKKKMQKTWPQTKRKPSFTCNNGSCVRVCVCVLCSYHVHNYSTQHRTTLVSFFVLQASFLMLSGGGERSLKDFEHLCQASYFSFSSNSSCILLHAAAV